MPVITSGKTINTRIMQVRELMKEEKIDLYIVSTSDYHMSEYAGDYFAERQFLTGFTGSAGTAVITQKKAVLFTDGRYFVQAQLQIEDSEFELMKMGYKNVPTLEQFCCKELPEGGCIGFDGRTIEAREGLKLQKIAADKNGKVVFSFDAVEQIWEDRPAFPESKVYELQLQYAGVSRSEKLEALKNVMNDKNVDSHLIASLDDICWLLNLRADDVACNPVMMSYLLLTPETIMLYIKKDRLSEQIIAALSQDGITIRPYEQIYEDITKLPFRTILLDPARINMKLYGSVPENTKKICAMNPTVLMKSKKNKIELANLKEIQIQDGLAVTRFMYWLKTSMEQQRLKITQDKQSDISPITEYSAAKYLDQLREQIPGYLDLSFDTISAYNANAAMLHYSASKDNCAELKPQGMLLVDSGGQYLQGTTDITRTFALGPVTDLMKKHFTLTLKGMLNLTYAHFLKGCTGFNLDILAREPLWNEGIDYRCGTGHGIGYVLNVHEAPNGFRWKHNPGVNDLCVFEEGMVTSNEPGVYVDGEYGIRIENMMVCEKDYENEYGEFLKFETLTYVPIDLDLIDCDYLDQKDKDRLNRYHKEVYEKLSPYLKGDELAFLKKYTESV